MNEDEQCFPTGGCPDGYHSNEDDETGTCYPDSEPCPDGQVRSDEGNYCIVPPEDDPESDICDQVFVPGTIPPECVPSQEELLQQQPEPTEDEPPQEGSGGDNSQNDESLPPPSDDEGEPPSEDEESDGDSGNGGDQESDTRGYFIIFIYGTYGTQYIG